MAEARLPSIASGNGRLLVTVDARGEVLSACWPSIDSPNQFATFKIQPAPGQAFEATPEPIPPRYVDETNISTSQSQQGLRFTDVVVDDIERNSTQVDFFARKISGPHPALRLLLQPNMDGRPGRLPGERIAFREVDGILELGQSTDDTIILSVFGRTREEVLDSLNERRDHQWTQFESLAKERATKVLTESTLQGWSPVVTRMLRRSSLVWDVLTNRSTGGMIAGPDVQLGIASAPGYAAFWARDAAWALLGTIDETGIILHCFKKYIDATEDTAMLTKHWTGVEKAAEFLMNSRDPQRGIPVPRVDLWEEREGFHLFTAASTIGGLRAAAALAEKLQSNSSGTKLWISVADDIQQRTEAQFWDERCGRFVNSLENSAALPMFDPERPEFNAKAVTYTQDISTIALAVPFGVLALDDPRIVATVDSIRNKLWNDQVGGLHRYDNDSYGGGNPWPLATLWLAIYEGERDNKEEAKRLVEWVVDHSTVAGLVPEQVHRIEGHPVASVPLSWSHAMVAIAVAACHA
ncbi:hypothetical protein ACJA88_001273 [Fusarium oxysporum]